MKEKKTDQEQSETGAPKDPEGDVQGVNEDKGPKALPDMKSVRRAPLPEDIYPYFRQRGQPKKHSSS